MALAAPLPIVAYGDARVPVPAESLPLDETNTPKALLTTQGSALGGSAFERHAPLQACEPTGHEIVQTEPTHAGDPGPPSTGPAQTFPHAPQFVAEVVVSTQPTPAPQNIELASEPQLLGPPSSPASPPDAASSDPPSSDGPIEVASPPEEASAPITEDWTHSLKSHSPTGSPLHPAWRT